MKMPSSIGRYIALQVSLLFFALIVIYSLSINKVYEWGIYDMTHYFISLQAEELYLELKYSDTLPPSGDRYTQYYLNYQQFPSVIKTLFPQVMHEDEVMLTAQIPGYTYYLLPYSHPRLDTFFYVLHTYSITADDYDVAIDIPELQIMLLLFVAVLVFLLVRNIALAIINPVKKLESWARSIEPECKDTITIEPESFRFKELQLVADRLATSVNNLESYHQREKGFLRTLSHELRTPLAITRAALDIMQKKSTQPLTGDALKLERMRRANNHMLATTECLLWLWSGKQRILDTTSVDIPKLVADAVAMNQYLLQHKAVTLDINISHELHYHCEVKLLKMVVENLLRNAFQYSVEGCIQIVADQGAIKVINPWHEEEHAQKNQQEDYGYGVGLYLVEKICEQKGWKLVVSQNQHEFQVTLQLAL